MAFNYESYYMSYINKIKERALSGLTKAYQDAYADFFKLVETKLKEMYKEAAEKFYGSYDPIYYDRRGSLKNLLITEVEYDSFSGEFDEKGITNRNDGSLYDQVFKQGYHGGASKGPYHPNDGTPWFRTQHPSKNEKRPWWRWSRYSAPKTESTYDMFIKMKTDWENSSDYDETFQKILAEKRSKYMKF